MYVEVPLPEEARLPFIALDRAAPQTLTRQVYERLRELILAGLLAPGARLDSTRRLAGELGVSRNVVLEAFDRLLAEGYLEARTGSGTFVASGAVFSPQPLPPLPRARAVGLRPYRADLVDFRSGLPDLSRFPVRTWQRLTREVWDRLTPLDLSYGQPEGREELRGEIARYIGAVRGVRCRPEQILVTSGTTQAIGLVSRLLLPGPDTPCVLEDPVTADIRRIIAGHGGRLHPVPVDGAGLVTGELPRPLRPALVYVTPSHQFPLGATLPIQRRVSLLQYAGERGAVVVEDDYDSEFRYDSPPIGSIQGLDPGRVAYIGTFSKTLFPALRIGYLVLPPGLIGRGRELKWFSDLHNASVDQLVLARFLREGHFERFVRAMKKVYLARRQALLAALRRHFGASAEPLGSAAGLHLCARFPGARFTPRLVAAAERAGVRLYPVEEHALRKGRWEDTLLFGYGMLEEARLEEGIAILARCL